jgi:uncharacterized OB-fold protein
MRYLPDSVPPPSIDETNAPFWENCRERRLTFQQCVDCQALVHPPLPVCPRCQSVERRWSTHRRTGGATALTLAFVRLTPEASLNRV